MHVLSEGSLCPELIHSASRFAMTSQSELAADDSDSSQCSDGGVNLVNNTAASSCPTTTNVDNAQITAPRSWPTYDQVSAHVLVADYREILTSGTDLHPESAKTTKLLCPHGVVAQVKLEFFDHATKSSGSGIAPTQPYTGLLTPGTAVEHGLLRLSSALRPVDHGWGAWAKAVARRTFGVKLAASQVLPAAALKVFRHNQPSINILLLGSKVGHASTNIFEHSLCTAVTEKIPALGLPFLRRFSRYSKYPLSLGLSEFCQYNVKGQKASTEDHAFPFALCLKPVLQLPQLQSTNTANNDSDRERPFDTFIDDVPHHVPAGSHLFDIYAAPSPESVSASHQLQRIGKIVSTSAFCYSSPTDGLTFRHQVKEDDLELQPSWEDRMHSHTLQYSSDGTKGTVAKMTGWQIFEEHIMECGDYVDFEQKHKKAMPDSSVIVAQLGRNFVRNGRGLAILRFSEGLCGDVVNIVSKVGVA